MLAVLGHSNSRYKTNLKELVNQCDDDGKSVFHHLVSCADIDTCTEEHIGILKELLDAYIVYDAGQVHLRQCLDNAGKEPLY